MSLPHMRIDREDGRIGISIIDGRHRTMAYHKLGKHFPVLIENETGGDLSKIPELKDILSAHLPTNIKDQLQGKNTGTPRMPEDDATLAYKRKWATGKWDGSMDIKSGNAMGLNLGSQITYDGNHFGVNATATNRYGLGMMVDAGIHGVSASLMMHGSQAGTVDQSGHYEANTDFLSGMNGQDIMDEYNNRAQEDANATLEGVGVQQTHEPEEPTGLLDLLMNYGSQAVSAIGDSFSPGGVFA